MCQKTLSFLNVSIVSERFYAQCMKSEIEDQQRFAFANEV